MSKAHIVIHTLATFASLLMAGVAVVNGEKAEGLAFFAMAVAFNTQARMELLEQRKGGG